MKTLDAGDLSNLAWAIARLANEKSTSAGFDSKRYITLSCWISERILELVDPEQGANNNSKDISDSILHHIQLQSSVVSFGR